MDNIVMYYGRVKEDFDDLLNAIKEEYKDVPNYAIHELSEVIIFLNERLTQTNILLIKTVFDNLGKK